MHEIIITASVSLPIGTIIGYYIRSRREHRLARSRNIESIQVSEFYKRAIAFRESFDNEIKLLLENIKTGNEMPSRIINGSVIEAHEKAKINIAHFLSGDALCGFNAAWDEYACCPYNCYKQPDNEKSDDWKEISCCCLEHIYNLFSFCSINKIAT